MKPIRRKYRIKCRQLTQRDQLHRNRLDAQRKWNLQRLVRQLQYFLSSIRTLSDVPITASWYRIHSEETTWPHPVPDAKYEAWRGHFPPWHTRLANSRWNTAFLLSSRFQQLETRRKLIQSGLYLTLLRFGCISAALSQLLVEDFMYAKRFQSGRAADGYPAGLRGDFGEVECIGLAIRRINTDVLAAYGYMGVESMFYSRLKAGMGAGL
ncbi:hypothetical protein BJ508DRAFT_379841 [Ascobolus immersus RN42]|uniref:Uncharacterized protein n=1 Tax=Ascobolus immersus RN42 TaxID=1160509 RepID=A0A3N4HTB2_ASCIM|nr:hypothetical protein BJ508DRAFT_379841 [Ascobolus immersus RN42]